MYAAARCLVRAAVLLAAARQFVAIPAAAAPPRYWAMWPDQATRAADGLDGGAWWEPNVKLGGRPLFAPADPARVFCDRSVSAAAAETYVLLANGDVLPGRPTQSLPAAADGMLPARVLIVPELPLQGGEAAGVWVRADRVLRIVAARGDPAAREPGTLVFADGRTLSANAIRWAERGVRALSDDGVVVAAFDEIRDLHLPKVDVIAAIGDDACYPPLDASTTVARLETAQGAALTWRWAMRHVSVRHSKHRGKTTPAPQTFLHVQPSWALGPLLVPTDAVACLGLRGASEVPLSQLPAEVAGQRAGLCAWPWRRNRNVAGEPLRSGPLTADLGIGMHAQLALAFDLPPNAQEFRALTGIDAAVAHGGCAVAKVFADKPNGKPLFASGFLRGGEPPADTGPLALGKARRLVLVADLAHQGRPADAFPLDIGDHLNWLLPTVKVGGWAADRRELAQRFLPGWGAWEFADEDLARLRLDAVWEESARRWLPELRFAAAGPITLRRKAALTPCANDVLEVALAPQGKAAAERIALEVDGVPTPPSSERSVGREPSREQIIREKREEGRTSLPPEFSGVLLRWDLQEFSGREVQLTLSLRGDAAAEPVLWHSFGLRAAVAGLAADGRPLRPDVPLLSLKPTGKTATKSNMLPVANELPHYGRHEVPIRFLGRKFANGYGMCSTSALVFAVEPNYKRFVALVGCSAGNVDDFQVVLDDGKTAAFSSGPMDEMMAAVQVDVELPPGTTKVTLKMLDGRYSSSAGGWAEAGFITE